MWRRIATALGIVGATVAVHEAAHALAAWRGGGAVREVGVGLGPALWRLRVRSLPLVLRAFPIGGYAAVDVERLPPRRRLPMLLAGPLANIAIGLPLLYGFRRHPAVALGEEGRTVGLTGVIGTFAALLQAAEHGRGALGRLAGGINVGLGLMNLLPIYPLDGGHIVASVLESRGAPPWTRGVFVRLSAAAFAFLVQSAMLADLRRLAARRRVAA
ncbi:MAG TPA: M50 family metallopeptidase [bacterium]|nr:M50 family metallopeptidase [bacterium]